MKTLKKILKIALFYALIPFVSSLPVMLVNGFCLNNGWVTVVGVPAVIIVVYLLLKRFSKLDKDDYKLGMYVNGVILLAFTLIFTVMMYIAEGNIASSFMLNFCWLLIPFAPSIISPFIMSQYEAVFIMAFLAYACGFVVCAVTSKKCSLKKLIIPVLCLAVCISSSSYLYANRPSVKYQGHGFDYMNGCSSTDFTDYMVYADNSKLVALDHQPSLVIEDETDMPVLDGAEACYPLYAAFAKATYKDIDDIERGYIGSEDYEYKNGKIVSFTNTINAFDRLIDKDADMIFGARPSQEQLDYAKECGVDVEITPIGKEAFVFFIEEDNPIDNLTSEQIRKIYHGDITNWKELGGDNQEIVAFQRPNNSGSQTMMTYFMNDVSLKEPKQFETVSAMEGVINEVAQYNNEAGAMGYTFRYFLEELNQEQNVKMISVDGVYPSLESVEDGSYPLTVDLCLITRKNDNNPNVEKMKAFILSADGQYIIHQTGYGKLKK